jgi:hypothetical protein
MCKMVFSAALIAIACFGLGQPVLAQGVSTFNGRSGAVVAVPGDYSAGQITYGPPGGGAAATNVATELGRYGVWANDYGAVCDGSTSDYAAFQSAINEAQSLGVPMRFAGVCATATAFSVTGKLEIAGVLGSEIIQTNPSQNGIVVNTASPVYFHDFAMNF